MKSMVHTVNFIFFIFLMVITGLLSLHYIVSGKWVLASLFTILFLLYFYRSFFIDGAIVRMDENGVQKNILGFREKSMKWDEIQEFGIIGTNVFQTKFFKWSGKKYIYFSTQKMIEKERFDMCLKWPPKGKIFLIYNPVRFEYVLQKCNKKPVYYNVGDGIL